MPFQQVQIGVVPLDSAITAASEIRRRKNKSFAQDIVFGVTFLSI
jgi:hypothetical protein